MHHNPLKTRVHIVWPREIAVIGLRFPFPCLGSPRNKETERS